MTDRGPLDRLRPSDELHESVPNAPMPFEMADDGMPKPASGLGAIGSALSRQNFVCMADTSAFVVRDRRGKILTKIAASVVTHRDDGRYDAPLDEVVLGAFGQGGVLGAMRLLVSLERDGSRAICEPIRRECRHMGRMLTDQGVATDGILHSVFCTARRDDGGEFMSLMDVRMDACNLRDPVHPRSLHLLARYSEKQLSVAAERAADETFDIETEIDKMGAGDAAGGGIFER